MFRERRDADLYPRCFRTRRRIMTAATVGCIVVPLVLLVTRSGDDALWLVVSLSAAFCVSLAWIIVNDRSRTIASRAAQGSHLPCWTCNYNLQGLGEHGSCPECGDTFERAELIQRWQRTLERLDRS
jgi:hypothetical protein